MIIHKIKIGLLAAILMSVAALVAAAQKTPYDNSRTLATRSAAAAAAAAAAAKTDDAATSTDKSADGAPASSDKDAKASKTAACESCRWFEPTAATFSFRYRNTRDVLDDPGFSQGQQRIVLGGRFKFDSQGRYSLNVQASTGYYFNWAYADSGWGNTSNEAIHRAAPTIANFATREVAPPIVAQSIDAFIAANYPGATPSQLAVIRPAVTAQLTPIVTQQVYNGLFANISTVDTRTKGWNLFIRQAYLDAKPIDGLEFQYGSLAINKGVNSEATSYDDDGYVMGGRVSVKRPKQFFFDEVSVTYAYFGDIFTPNFFRRTERVKQSNYHQFLVRKSLFGGKLDASTDYTFQDGSDTLRQGLVLDTRSSNFIDAVRFEAYQRIGDNVVWGKTFKGGAGFYAAAEREFAKKLNVTAGFASIDRQYSVYGEYTTQGLDYYGFGLNGDQTGLGNRFVGKATYKISDEVGVSMLFSRSAFNDDGMRFFWNRQAFNVAVTCDFLKAARRVGLFR